MTTPARAALLSAFLPGWGQVRLGRRKAALLFAGLEALAWILVFGWLVVPAFSPVLAPFGGLAVLVLRIAGAFRAFRAAGGRGLALYVPFVTLFLLLPQYIGIAMAVRFTAFSVYRMAGSSLEPTIMGAAFGAHSGAQCRFGARHVNSEPDRLVVSRLAYLFGDPRRWDLACFRFPLDPSHEFIKRVAGLPGEALMLKGGEVWVRPPGEADFRVARKPPEIQESVWVDLDADTLRAQAAFTPAWSGQGTVRDGHLLAGPDAEFVWSSEVDVDDRLVAFEVQTEGPDGVARAEIRCRYGRFEASWPGDLRWYPPGAKETKERRPVGERLQPGRFHRVGLATADGRAVAWLDGREVVTVEFLKGPSDVPSEAGEDRLAFGIRGGPARIRNLRVARDLCWRGRDALEEGVSVVVPAGHYVVLGDNAAFSHDSRSWIRVSVTLPDGTAAYYEQQADAYSGEAIGGIRLDGRPVRIPHDLPKEAREPFTFLSRDCFLGRVTRVWWPLERARTFP